MSTYMLLHLKATTHLQVSATPIAIVIPDAKKQYFLYWTSSTEKKQNEACKNIHHNTQMLMYFWILSFCKLTSCG